jgi:hypothetical protein
LLARLFPRKARSEGLKPLQGTETDNAGRFLRSRNAGC